MCRHNTVDEVGGDQGRSSIEWAGSDGCKARCSTTIGPCTGSTAGLRVWTNLETNALPVMVVA